MRGDILRKEVKSLICEEWGWVTGRVVSFCNIEVTNVTDFGSSVSARMLETVAVYEEESNRNKMTYEMSKAPSKSIYIDHNFVTSVIDSEMIT